MNNGTMRTLKITGQIVAIFLIIAGLIANYAVSKYKVDQNYKQIEKNSDEIKMLKEFSIRVDERTKNIEKNTEEIKKMLENK